MSGLFGYISLQISSDSVMDPATPSHQDNVDQGDKDLTDIYGWLAWAEVHTLIC